MIINCYINYRLYSLHNHLFPSQYYRGQARYRVGQSTNLSNDGELPPLAKKPSISYFPVFGNNAAKNKVVSKVILVQASFLIKIKFVT